MAETGRQPKFRTLVASFLFTDLVGYSKGTAAEQYAAKDTLAAILRSNLAALQDNDYRIKDTGDGALIAFVSNPEHALYMALAIAEDFGRAAKDAGFPSNSLRTGIHLGSVKESQDMEARPNFVGDGINAAKRIMDFAEPGQITASRAFFEAVGSLDSAYAELFTHVGAPDDKHGRAHDMYVIAPSTAVLKKIELEIDAAYREATKVGTIAAAPIKVRRLSPEEVAAGPQVGPRPSPAGGAVRKAAIPVIAVVVLGIALVFVGTRLIEPNGSKSPQATSTVNVSPAPPKQAIAPPKAAQAPADAQEARTSPAIPPKPEAAPPVRTAPVAEAAPKPKAASPVAAAPVAEAAPTPDLTQPPPTTTPAAKAAKSSVAIKPKAESSLPGTAPADGASDRNSPRCSRIMEKATLGEALSTEEKRELANSCH